MLKSYTFLRTDFLTLIISFSKSITSKFQKQSLEVFCKNGVLKKFARFTGKYLCQSLLFNKVVGHRPATLSKRRLWQRYFLVNFPKFLRPAFFLEHLRWLFLKFKRKQFHFTYTSEYFYTSEIYKNTLNYSITKSRSF